MLSFILCLKITLNSWYIVFSIKKKSSSCSADAPVPYVENATLPDPGMCGDPAIDGSHTILNDAKEACACD